MSPEQARGLEDVDHRSDIWSFCVVLYELISGSTPFTATNYNALLRSIVEEEPKPLNTGVAADEELWHILQRGLQKARDQRFRSMSELGRALASWLIRQDVVEDVCGGSLDAKWILRASDPTALKAARASLSSVPSLPPESGVRPTHDLATAVTVGAALTPSGSESEKPSTPEARSTLRATAPIWAAAGAAAIVVVLALLTLRTRSEPGADRAPALAPVREVSAEPANVAPAITVEPVPMVQVAPSAVPAPVESPTSRPAPTIQNRTHPARPAPSSSSTGASSDLLSPY
jgi:serine/threonine-protein kinase